jgi:maltokinase
VFIGETNGQFAYDALHDDDVSALVLANIADGVAIGDLRFSAEPGPEIDRTARGLVIGAEQSNTSIVYGHASILKVFRRLEPGLNPDAEVHRALWAAGSKHIATPLGVIEGPVAGERTTLALLTEFFANSAEGWAMATASVRDLMAEGDLRADEVGGDFASEALRLGKAVAEVHADLAAAFGTRELTSDAVAELIDSMISGAEAVAGHVPSIALHLPEIRAAFRRADTSAATLTVQRIHGDLQLGQTLRTLTGWAIIDFEGEPSKSLAHRRAMHSPLRDVAGMMRSFDYAANHSGGQSDSQHAYRAHEWADRNRAAFCDGYAAVAGYDPRDMGSLLAAFELDKAVYEVAYEHGHRPTWEPIPLQAVVRLINTGGKS